MLVWLHGIDGLGQKFLLSWHHLTCYISSLEVSDEYIEALTDSDTLPDIHPQPVVRRSAPLSLKKEDERVTIANILVQMAIEELKQYKRHRDLVKFLVA